MKPIFALVFCVNLFFVFPALRADEQNSETPIPVEKKELLQVEGLQFPESTTGEDILNLAIETKLIATSLADLTRVILYCEEAEKRGFNEDCKELCHQLKISTQLQRGLAIYQNIFGKNDMISQWNNPTFGLIKQTMTKDLEVAVQDSPEQVTAQLVLGRIYMMDEGKIDEAKKAFELVIEHGKDEPFLYGEALRFRAQLEEDPAKELEYLEKALQQVPSNIKLQEDLAIYWLKIKNYGQVIKLVDTLLDIENDNADFLKIKARALAGLGEYDEAEKIFSMAIPEHASQLGELLERAQFLASIHKNKEAIETFTRLLARDSNSPGILYMRALMYLQEKNYKSALKDVDRCLKTNPQFTEALQLKGVIYLQQEKFEDAIRIFKVLQIRSPSDSTTCQIAYAFAKKGELEQAIQTIKEALTKNENNIELLRCRGDIELMFGQWKETIATYEKILELNPKDTGVLNNYSWLLATSPDDSIRNGTLALEYGKKAAELTYFAEAHILSTLGAAYAESGDFENAKIWAEKAVTLATRERHDRLDDLKSELDSYQANKPWREIPEMLKKPQTVATPPESETKPETSDEKN